MSCFKILYTKLESGNPANETFQNPYIEYPYWSAKKILYLRILILKFDVIIRNLATV